MLKLLMNLINLKLNEFKIKDLENYAKMINYAKSHRNSKYIKYLNKISQDKLNKKIFIGDGTSVIELFIELSKLLAAKQAGHNNVKDSVEEIIDELIARKYLSKNKKIMKKYFCHLIKFSLVRRSDCFAG